MNRCEPPAVSRPRLWVRVTASLIIAAVAASLIAAAGRYYGAAGASISDYDQVWIASRALLDGASPYGAAAAHWEWGTPYPPPAFLVNMPFALFPLPAARWMFYACAVVALGVGCTRLSLKPLWLFGSGAFLVSTLNVQWAPLLMAGVFVPALSVAWVAKPTLGLALWVGWPHRVSAGGAVVLLVIGTFLVPGWWGPLREAAAIASHIQPAILRPFGWIILAAAARWRRPEARFLSVFACVPHTEAWYDLLLLFLIPQKAWEYGYLAVASLLGVWLSWRTTDAPRTIEAMGDVLSSQWPFMLILMYIPCVAMVLSRPNVGSWRSATAPPWVFRLVRRARWTRGGPARATAGIDHAHCPDHLSLYSAPRST